MQLERNACDRACAVLRKWFQTLHLIPQRQRLTDYNSDVTRSRTQTSEIYSRFLSSRLMPNHSQSTNLSLEPQNQQRHHQSRQLPHLSRRNLSMSAQIHQPRGGGWTLEALRPQYQNHIRQSSLRGSQAPQLGDHNDFLGLPTITIPTTLQMLLRRRTSQNHPPNLRPQNVPRPAAQRATDLWLHCQQRAVFQHNPHPSQSSRMLRRWAKVRLTSPGAANGGGYGLSKP